MTEEQQEQLKRLAAYFPYRIVFAVVMPDGEFRTYAKTDKRQLNYFLRKGYTVYTLEKGKQ